MFKSDFVTDFTLWNDPPSERRKPARGEQFFYIYDFLARWLIVGVVSRPWGFGQWKALISSFSYSQSRFAVIVNIRFEFSLNEKMYFPASDQLHENIFRIPQF